MTDEKTRNDYDDGNIPEVDLPGEDEYEENSHSHGENHMKNGVEKSERTAYKPQIRTKL